MPLNPLSPHIERPRPVVVTGLAALAPTEVADVLDLSSVIHRDVHALWDDVPVVAGPAFTVRTGRHDNLMLHAAIYLAEPGDVLVVQAGDDETAVAGGNVCAIAQRRGIKALIVDGVVRDVAESRARGFPLFARGRSPIPAKRVGEGGEGTLGEPVRCGGALVGPGDVVVAGAEGIVVVPRATAGEVLAKATAKAEADRALDLDGWQARHRAQVEAALAKRGLALPRSP